MRKGGFFQLTKISLSSSSLFFLSHFTQSFQCSMVGRRPKQWGSERPRKRVAELNFRNKWQSEVINLGFVFNRVLLPPMLLLASNQLVAFCYLKIWLCIFCRHNCFHSQMVQPKRAEQCAYLTNVKYYN